MKTLLCVLIGCLSLTLVTSSFAGCYRSGEFTSCRACQSGSPYVTECQCTDPNVGRNDCMSVDKYCEAFGNVGAR